MVQTTIPSPLPGVDERVERRVPMSYEAWRAWPEAEGRQTEWVDGEVIVFVPSSIEHAEWAWFLSTLLGLYVRMRGLGVLLVAPFEVSLTPHLSREPDILFVAREHRDHIEQTKIAGPVDLAVELISDDSVGRDRHQKFREYAAAGVPEYWIFDPRHRHRSAEFFALVAGGYRPIPPDAAGRLHSRVLSGFWLRPDWLRREPLANPLACLLELAPDALAGLAPGAAGEPTAPGHGR